jgi:hypothetical protein
MEDNEARFLRRSDLDDDGDIFCLFHYLVFYWNNSPLGNFIAVTVAVYKQSLSCFLLEILQQSPVLCLSSGELEN